MSPSTYRERRLRSSRAWSAFAALAAVFAILSLAAPLRAAAPPSLDLSGPWLYRAGDDIKWSVPATSDKLGWTTVSVPGASAGPGAYWYRKHFEVPFDWSGDNATAQLKYLNLHLGSLHGAATVFLNGYKIGDLGTMPSSAATGAGFQPITSADDIIVRLPTVGATTKNAATQFINFGQDNLLALRVYDSQGGPNPTTGPLRLDKATFADIYPVSIQQSVPNQLYDTEHPCKFTLTFTNTTTERAPLVWSMDVKDDTGASTPGFPSQEVNDSIDGGNDKVYNPTLAFGETPGFYTVSVDSKTNDQNIPAKSFVAGWNALKIRVNPTPPADFAAYWTAVRAEAASKPLNQQITKDTAASVAGVTAYRVKFDGIDGKPVLAWLSVPDNTGAAKAILHIPAYGADATGPDVTLAKRGFVVMDFLVTATDYTTGNAAQHYFSTGVGDPKSTIFRTIEGNVLRAARLLRSGQIEGVAGSPKLILWGESQGGGLSLITAGLLKQEVSAVVAISPYFTDMPHTLKVAKADSNPFAGATATPTAINHTLAYFDTLNFAPKVTAPVFLGIGLRDTISPPYSIFAMSNYLDVNHLTDINPESGHIPPTSAARAVGWLGTTVR